MRKVKIIYCGDVAGDIEEERKYLEDVLSDYLETQIKIESNEFLEDILEENNFDVLLFDWGGMSFGNSLLEHFSKRIIEHARENPSKIYIMTSYFTAQAMIEIQNELKLEPEETPNIYLEKLDAVPYIKIMLEE